MINRVRSPSVITLVLGNFFGDCSGSVRFTCLTNQRFRECWKTNGYFAPQTTNSTSVYTESLTSVKGKNQRRILSPPSDQSGLGIVYRGWWTLRYSPTKKVTKMKENFFSRHFHVSWRPKKLTRPPSVIEWYTMIMDYRSLVVQITVVESNDVGKMKWGCSIICPTHHGQYITLRLLYHLQYIVGIGGKNPSRSSKIEIGCSKRIEQISYSKNNQ